MYYVANKDTNYTFNDWYDHVINQRIGVAVADSPNGPWTRSVQPACVPAAPILGYVVNPAVVRMPSGKYLMLLKGRAANQPAGATADAMGNYRIGTALADRPMGPFVIQPAVLFDAPGAVFEDPCVFLWNGRAYAAVKDSNGQVSGTPEISWISGSIGADGTTVTWTIPYHDPNALISARQIKWSDGTTTTLHNLERPFILQDDAGRPTHLYCAAAVADPSYLSPYPPTPLDRCRPSPGPTSRSMSAFRSSETVLRRATPTATGARPLRSSTWPTSPASCRSTPRATPTPTATRAPSPRS
jgi:hypothetical protein